MIKIKDPPIIQENLQGTLKKASKSAVWTTRVVPLGRNLDWPFLSSAIDAFDVNMDMDNTIMGQNGNKME